MMGGSQLLIDDKIKFKHGHVQNFTSHDLSFEDGFTVKQIWLYLQLGKFRELSPRRSLINSIMANRLGSYREVTLKFLGENFRDKLNPIWGFSKEREFQGTWRSSGIPNLWVMLGGNDCLFTGVTPTH